MRLGFACSWWHPRKPTWSYTPIGLLDALHRQDGVEIASIDAQRPLAGKAALALAHRLTPKTAWQFGEANRRLQDRKTRRTAEILRCDAVLAMSVLEPGLAIPAFFYQDMGFLFALSQRGRGGASANLLALSRRRFEVLACRERERYAAAAGVFTMGTWFAQWLIEHAGLPPDKVHAVGGGLNAVSARRRVASPDGRHGRLLFVGRDFHRKGGDLAVNAVGKLVAGGEGHYRLTVVGPSDWPLAGEPPPWVSFLGSLPPSGVARLWADHDVFVLPSRFDAYGLALLEARAAGLPCVARREFAMPELVPEGRAGTLVSAEADAQEIAAAIHRVCTNTELFGLVAADADKVARQHSWDTVAGRIVDVTRRTVGLPAPPKLPKASCS